MTVLEQIREYALEAEKLRQHIHENPELSFKERLTTKIIEDFCKKINLDIIDTGLETGVVAVLKGGHGTAVALRADIDAIELNGKPAHLCGHDYHTASLLCAAWYMSKNRELLNGDVVFIFQPAEEITRGAAALLATGFLNKLENKPSVIFGIHNRPELPIGNIAVKRGALMAGKHNFIINIQGKTGHGGSPHKCHDPIVAAAGIVDAIQTIVSRSVDPFSPCVCSVCSIHGGSEANFAPDSVKLTGSIRYLDDAVYETVSARLKEIVHSIANAHSCTATLEFLQEVPVLVNSRSLYEIAHRASSVTVSERHTVKTKACMGCEDFAIYGEFMRPFFYFVGAGIDNTDNPPWHSTDFKVHSAYLQIASALYVNSVLEAQKNLEELVPN